MKKMIGKNAVFLGAVVVALLMVSSVTAVPQVNSESVMKQFERIEKAKVLLNDIRTLSNGGNFDPDQLDRDLIDKFVNFYTETYLVSEEFTDFSYDSETSDTEYDETAKQLLDGLLVKLEEVNHSLDAIRREYILGSGPSDEAMLDMLEECVDPIFEDFFGSEEFTDLMNSEKVIQLVESLENKLKKVSQSKQSSLQVESTGNDPDNNVDDDPYMGTQSLPLDWVDVMIRFCTRLYKVNFFAIGVGIIGDLLGDPFMSVGFQITTLICLMIIAIPCLATLRGSSITGFFEGFIGTIWACLKPWNAVFEYVEDKGWILGPMILLLAVFVQLVLIIPEFVFAICVGVFMAFIGGGNWTIEDVIELMEHVLGEAATEAWEWYEARKGKEESGQLIELLLAKILDRIMDKFPMLAQLLSSRPVATRC